MLVHGSVEDLALRVNHKKSHCSPHCLHRDSASCVGFRSVLIVVQTNRYLQKQSMSCCRRKWDARRYFVLVRGILHEYKNEKHYKDHGLPTASEGICEFNSSIHFMPCESTGCSRLVCILTGSFPRLTFCTWV